MTTGKPMPVASWTASSAVVATPSLGMVIPYASQTPRASGAVSASRLAALAWSRILRTAFLSYAISDFLECCERMRRACAARARYTRLLHASLPTPVSRPLHALQMTFFDLRAATSAAAYPSSARTSSVCSPSKGERLTSVGLSLILMGLPTVRYLPRFGWSTSTMVPVLRKLGSLANSSMDKIGPQGMSCSLSSAMASNLVFVTVHASTVANTSLSLGRRASGVAYLGSVIQSSLPITLQISFQIGACAMKYKYAFGSVSQPLHLRMVPGCPPPDALAARGTAAPNLPLGYCGYSFMIWVRSRRCWSRSLTRHRFRTPSCMAASTLWPRPVVFR